MTPYEILVAKYKKLFPAELSENLEAALQESYDLGRENGLDAAALDDRWRS